VDGMGVIFALVPVVVVVIVGTYFLFTQLSVFVIHRLKANRSVFWKKTNMLLLSDLSFRMKDNARTFFMVAVVSTVAFSAIGSLYGFKSLLNDSIKQQNPFSMTYTLFEEDSQTEQQDVEQINHYLQGQGIEAHQEKVNFTYFTIDNFETPERILKLSDFNRLAVLAGEKEIVIPKNGVAVMEMKNNAFPVDKSLRSSSIPLTSGESVKPNQVVQTDVIPYTRGFIVSDSLFEKLGSPVRTEPFYAWQSKASFQKMADAGKVLGGKLQKGEQPSFFATDWELYELNAGYGPTLFVGLFIGMVFFVSAGSILYFRLYSDLDEDKEKFRAIAKMGLTEQELKKVLNQQIAILFFSPIIVALLHGIVALTALSNMFYQPFFVECIYVLVIFAAIQIVYFFIVRYFYSKQIKSAL